MKTIRTRNLLATALVGALSLATTIARASDPLPSWNDAPAKQAIAEFVRVTTEAGGAKLVPLEERIATLHQDGTLCVSHPMYSRVMYCRERLPALAAKHPQRKKVERFKTEPHG